MRGIRKHAVDKRQIEPAWVMMTDDKLDEHSDDSSKGKGKNKGKDKGKDPTTSATPGGGKGNDKGKHKRTSACLENDDEEPTPKAIMTPGIQELVSMIDDTKPVDQDQKKLAEKFMDSMMASSDEGECKSC